MTPAQRKIKDWRENPAQFCHEKFKVDLDIWQREACDAFPSQDPSKIRIALKACAGPGKTAIEAMLGWNFLSCYGDRNDHPKGAAVAVTAANLNDNLWPEFAKWQGMDEHLSRAFTWTKKRIYNNDHPETWFFSARSYSKTANPEEQGRTLSGLHGGFVMIIADEAGDIPVQVLKAGEQAMSTKGRFKKILIAGNPTSHHGVLYAASTRLAHLWHVITITGDPDDPRRSPRISAEWAAEQIKTYGRDDPWVMAFILGLFPNSSVDTLFSPDEVEKAMLLDYDPEVYQYAQRRLGVDAARFGDDMNVLFPRQGLVAHMPIEMRKKRANEIVARILKAHLNWPFEREFVDGTGGYGAGIVDGLIAAGRSPMEVNFSGSAQDPRYGNTRAEMWFRMSEWVKRGGQLPNLRPLVRQLTTPTYSFRNGKFMLEPKEMIKKRLGFSPDHADALALTFYLPEAAASGSLDDIRALTAAKKGSADWDPFDPNRA